MDNMLRKIPSVGELLERPPLASLVNRVSHNVVVTRVGQFLDELRGQVQGATGVNIPSPAELAERIARWIATEERTALRPAINATGILLHPLLGGPPLAEDAVGAMCALASGYSTADLDGFTGQAAERSASAQRLVGRLTGAEAVMVTSSVAAAGWIVLSALSARREVLVARSQVSAFGNCRLTELASAAGAVLREVGTTNQATSDDYAAALGASSGLLFVASPGSYVVVGASAEPALAELAAIGRRSNVPVVHDLGVGSVIDCTSLGLPNQPVAKDSIEAGADLVVLAGDQLLGGPPCGIILGKRSLVQTIRKHPLLPAIQADTPTLAALLATLRLYEDPATAERAIPLLSMLATPLENLRNRAERLAPQITATGLATAEVREATTTLTGAAIPAQILPTVGLWLTPASGTAAALAAALRMATPSVVGRLADDRVVLDLRSVPPRSDVPLVSAIESLARGTPAATAEASLPGPP